MEKNPTRPDPPSEFESMDHSVIENRGIVELYVTGRLAADDLARFEEHYLDCPSCIADVEDAERLQRGLARVMVQDAMKLSFGQMIARKLRSPGLAWVAMAAGLVVIAGLPSLWMHGRMGDLEQRLIQAHVETSLALQPRINTPVIELSPFRSTSSLYSLSLPSTPEWLVFSLTPVQTGKTYEALLKNSQGLTTWQASGLQPDPSGRLNMAFYSTQFEPGLYRIELIVNDTAPSPSTDRSTEYRLEFLEFTASKP